MKYVGTRVWPIDWDQRTSGQTAYTGDLVPPDALVGAILRSPHPHAHIASIDTSLARSLPGVRAIITSDDFPKGLRYFHERTLDRPPLADGVVRFVGQEIAAVAADTKAQAQAAVAAIRVRYHRLPAPLELKGALAKRAPLLFPAEGIAPHASPDSELRNVRAHLGSAPQPVVHQQATYEARQHNVRRRFRRFWGKPEEGRAASSVSVSGRFWFPQQNHVCMETQRTLARWIDGRLHLWTSTASPRLLARQLAHVFSCDVDGIVVHEVGVGGSFGAKMTITDHEALAGTLARITGRPVYIALTREEEFETTGSRHAFDFALNLRADDTGRIRLIEGEVDVDSGAYLHSGMPVMSASMFALAGIYNVDGLDVRARLVDTAKLPARGFRGYGAPQVCFALESLVDELAARTGQDPIEIRIKNVYRTGDLSLASGKLGSVGLVECLRAARTAINWDEEKANRKPGRGVGVAVAEHISGAFTVPGANRSDGTIELSRDGRILVRFGGSDAGTGQKTILAQIAAEELGLPLERVSVHSMNTDTTPFDLGAWSSRGTHYTGHAIRLTAQALAAKLRRLAAQRLNSEEILLEDGYAKSAGGKVPIGDLVALSNEAINGRLAHTESFVESKVEQFNPQGDGSGKITPTHNFGAHAALVEVDEKTGQVRILDYVAANDSGTALNPTLLEGQIVGGAVMGLGGALGEELIFEQGKLVNPAFLHYGLPRAADVPTIRPLLVPAADPVGPYGAKASGEVSISPPGPAIANAIYDAIGVRITSLPITPDKILSALASLRGRKRKFGLWRRPDRWWVALVRWLYRYGLFRVLHEVELARHGGVSRQSNTIEVVETPTDVPCMIELLSPQSRLLGGGTDVQLSRRQGLLDPTRLVSVGRVASMKRIAISDDGSISAGGAVTLSKLAATLRAAIPALGEAIDEIATPQIRNMATLAGNLLQTKRCWFFRNGFNCYKRRGGLAPCYAIRGDHRFYHAAIDGHRCQAVTPSDIATVLIALDAVAVVAGPNGTRKVLLEELYVGPGETSLGEKDVLVEVHIPARAWRRRTAFKKLRLWQGDFAVASVAFSLDLDSSGNCVDARLCLGAVAPVPWRARLTERAVVGAPIALDRLRVALDRELDARAHPLDRNEWKLDAVAGLAERAAESIAASVQSQKSNPTVAIEPHARPASL